MNGEVSKPVGLRELKKRRTRRAIQEHALRLFTVQGYEATTTDQIAAAAEVSPSTLFRYFKTKEDLVIQDDYDPMILSVIREAPGDLGVFQTLRHVLRTVFAELGEDEEERIRERARLILTVPSLRSRVLDSIRDTTDLLVGALAQRPNHNLDEFSLRALSGAMVGVWIVVLEQWSDDDMPEPLAEVIDRALGVLERHTRWE